MVEQIENGVVAGLSYTLKVDGDVVEMADADNVLEYLHGAENIVPGLEKVLTGKKVGDKFEVTLAPADAYGEYDDELLEAIDRADFDGIDGIEPGVEILLEDEDGDMFEVLVREVTADAVIVDFNPPLAGKTLTYSVEVISLRNATEEELETGVPASLFDELSHEFEDYDYDEADYSLN